MTIIKKLVIYLICIISLIGPLLFTFIIYRYLIFLNYFEQTLLYSLAAGALGSGVYLTRGFYKSIAEDNTPKAFNFKWIWWYLCRPILGIISGFIVVLMIYLAFDLKESLQNQIAIYFLCFICGFNFHYFIENKIGNKTDFIF